MRFDSPFLRGVVLLIALFFSAGLCLIAISLLGTVLLGLMISSVLFWCVAPDDARGFLKEIKDIISDWLQAMKDMVEKAGILLQSYCQKKATPSRDRNECP